MDCQRNSFRLLKPTCLAVNQAVLEVKASRIPAVKLRDVLISLEQGIEDAEYLDRKLAYYVFFPISLVLRETANLPAPVITVALRCLQPLIRRGWGVQLPREVKEQLLVLFTRQVEVVGPGCTADAGLEQLVKTALDGITCLEETTLDSPRIATEGQQHDTGSTEYALFTCLSFLETNSTEVQLSAAAAITAIWSKIDSIPTARRFLPGIVSRTVNNLKHTQNSRSSYSSIVAIITVLKKTVLKCLHHATTTLGPSKEDDDWLSVTEPQLSLALLRLAHLPYHDRSEVRAELFSLAVALLEQTELRPVACRTWALEAAIIIRCEEEEEQAHHTEDRLCRILNEDNELVEHLRGLLREWIDQIPRVSQSSGDMLRKRHFQKTAGSYRIIERLSRDTLIFDDELQDAISQAVISLIESTTLPAIIENTSDISELSAVSITKIHCKVFDAGMNLGSHGEGLRDISKFLAAMSPVFRLRLGSSLNQRILLAESEQMLSTFWLAAALANTPEPPVESLKNRLSHSKSEGDPRKIINDSIYRASVELLSKGISGIMNHHARALALGIVGTRAKEMGKPFRMELVDVLYLVLESLGSPSMLIAEQGITCLNEISRACEYVSAADLVIENVDYLVNAVSVRFNTFEISSESPKIIVMMLNLCGPRLLPYLDDMIESIFAALASYHGYPRLVEALFSVLVAFVKTAASALPTLERALHPGYFTHQTELIHLARLSSYLQKEMAKLPEPPASLNREFEDGSDIVGSGSIEENDSAHLEGRGISRHEHEKISDTAMKSTTSFVKSIIRSTQHYASHESPVIRQKMVELASYGCNLLAPEEDDLLPVINEIWPTVNKRLYDSDMAVSRKAIEAVSTMLRTAGNFMASRIELEWTSIRSLFHHINHCRRLESQSRATRGHFSVVDKAWQALMTLVLDLAYHVRLIPEVEDDVTEILALGASERPDVQKCGERLNEDSTWLATLKTADSTSFTTPVLEGFKFARIVV